jgi:hypothetical protein
LIRFHDGGKLYTDWGINRFPDGQLQFKIKPALHGLDLDISITDSEQLDLFFQIVNTIQLRSIRIVYLYGGRSDKDVAGEFSVANLPDIIVRILGVSKNLHPVTQFETVMPHSKAFPGERFLPIHPELAANQPNYDLILFPDESASNRFLDHFKGIEKRTCAKERDQVSGNIIKHVMPDDLEKFKRILVADDLCDGGRTFLDVRDAVDAHHPERIDLYVTHGVFSNGALERLDGRFSTVWTTNSYQEFGESEVLKILNVWRASEE